MSATNCPLESSIIAARRRGPWNETLEVHLKGCPVCTETDRVGAWMRHLVDDAAARPLIDSNLLWMRAQLFSYESAARRVLRPLVWIEALAPVLLGAGLTWTVLRWPKGQAFMVETWMRAAGSELMSNPVADAGRLTLLAIWAALILTSAALAIRRLAAD